MGFLDFFKKTRKEEEEKEEISFQDLEDWVNKKDKKIKQKEIEIIEIVKEKIPIARDNISEKLKKLESNEIALGKPEGRIETIVKENLENYMSYVRNLLKDFSDIKEKEYSNISEYIDKINNIFSYFEKKSYMNYQKAIYLVKKDLIETNKSVMNFSKELKTVFEKNKETVYFSRNIRDLKKRLIQFNELTKNIKNINKNITESKGNLEKLKKDKKNIYSEIEALKKNEKYIENLKKIAKADSLELGIQKEIFILKSFVDFKKLAHVFHHDKKKLDRIKKYKEHFYTSFNEDREGFLSLISEAGLKNKKIEDCIDIIKEKKKEFSDLKKEIKNDDLNPLETQIKKIDSEIEKIEIEIDKKNKKLEKFLEDKKEHENKIKECVENLGGKILDS